MADPSSLPRKHGADTTVRPTRKDDLAALQDVLLGTELFPSEMLPGLIADFLSGNEEPGLWLTCETEGRAVGFCCATPEQLTDGAWNMRALAVLPSKQGNGCGSAIASRLEADLRARGHRILIAETSGTAESARTRAFYLRNGYTEEARIRDFWAEGDDKIVFWKSLR